MEEYVGWNIGHENSSLKFTQPVIVQIFKDEFDITNHVLINPIEPGTTMAQSE